MNTQTSPQRKWTYGAVGAAALVPLLIGGMATAAWASVDTPDQAPSAFAELSAADARPTVTPDALQTSLEDPLAETPAEPVAPTEPVRDQPVEAPIAPLAPIEEPTDAATGDPDPAPTVTITLPDNLYAWYAKSFVVEIQASSRIGDVESITWTTSGAQEGTATVAGSSATLTISAAGTTTIEAVAFDSEGNGSTTAHRTAKIDLTPPLIEVLQPVGGAYRVGDTVTPNANCSDPESGISIDGTSWCSVFIEKDRVGTNFQLGQPYTFTVAGDYTLGGRVRNGAGVYTEVNLGPLRVVEDEDVPPTVTVDASPLPSTGWYRAPVDVSFTATDSGAGVRTVMYRVPTSATEWGPWLYVPGDTATLVIETDGPNRMQYRAVDFFDNVSEIQDVSFPRDGTNPSVTITEPADGVQVEVGESLILNYSCADVLSGIASCGGTVNSGAALDTDTAGIHEYLVIATDKAGNRTEMTRSYTVVAPDVTAPTVHVGEPETVPASGWFTGDTVFRMLAEDNVGVQSLRWTGEFPTGTSGDTTASSNVGFMISIEGATTFRFSAADAAGNRSADEVFVLRIDKTNPTVAITSPAVKPGLVAVVTEVTQGSVVDFDFACADAISGVASCVSSVGDTLPTDVLGARTATVTATDVAGRSTVETINYTVVAGRATGGGGTGGSAQPSPTGDGLALTGASTLLPLVASGLLLVGGIVALLVGTVVRRRA